MMGRRRFQTSRMVLALSAAISGGCCFGATNSPVTTLASFTGANGINPGCGGVTDASGNFYGTTQGGGAYGDGTLFEIAAADHSLHTLVNFNQSTGYAARGGITLDLNGNLYGVTGSGGSAGSGTIYEYTLQTQNFTMLASFNGSNGSSSDSGLVADAAGDLFGTTHLGGAYGGGTIFELSTGSSGSNKITTLANLNSSTGTNPFCGLAMDKSGNLYGTAYNGGTSNYGTLFEFNQSAKTVSTLVNFNSSNGYWPSLAPVIDSAGNLYGATTRTVFEISAGSSTLQTLNNVLFPVGMTGDSSGNIYIDTINDAYNNYGSVIEFPAATHALIALGGFQYPDNTNGESGLAFDSSGNLYGTRWLGGTASTGEVFELAASVPEPAAMAFVLPGFALLLLRNRKRVGIGKGCITHT